MKPHIRMAGVPEHFNVPWHWGIEKGMFASQDLDLEWTDYPTGTGAMCRDLNEGNLDMAILLTEGAVADISKGGQIKMLQWYVSSPLTWGIHVAEGSEIVETGQMTGKKYGISRIGSGSHLMAFVDAAQRGFLLSEEQLVIVNNMDGAVAALSAGKADIFLWEKFMTKPLVDIGIFRRIGEIPTPWPSFVIAASDKFIQSDKRRAISVAECIRSVLISFTALENKESIIAKKINLSLPDVNEWIKTVEWQTNPGIDPVTIQEVAETLLELNLIPQIQPFDRYVLTIDFK